MEKRFYVYLSFFLILFSIVLSNFLLDFWLELPRELDLDVFQYYSCGRDNSFVSCENFSEEIQICEDESGLPYDCNFPERTDVEISKSIVTTSNLLFSFVNAMLIIFPTYVVLKYFFIGLEKKYRTIFTILVSFLVINVGTLSWIGRVSPLANIRLYSLEYELPITGEIFLHQVNAGVFIEFLAYAVLFLISGYGIISYIKTKYPEIKNLRTKTFWALFFLSLSIFLFEKIISSINNYLRSLNLDYESNIIQITLMQILSTIQSSIPWFITNAFEVFLGILIVYGIIVYYEKLRKKIYYRPKLFLIQLIKNHPEKKIDFLHFLMLSLLISFLQIVVFEAIGDQEIVDFIPFFDSFSSVLSNTPSITLGDTSKGYGNFWPGPSIGVMLALALRIFRYKEEKKEDLRQKQKQDDISKHNLQTEDDTEDKYPGARILLIFIILVTLLVILDAYAIATYIPEQTDENTKFILPEVYTKFFLKLASSPGFYAGIIFTWMADWYIFSNLFDRKKVSTIN